MFEAFESGTQSELGWSPPSLAGHDSEANETDPRAALHCTFWIPGLPEARYNLH